MHLALRLYLFLSHAVLTLCTYGLHQPPARFLFQADVGLCSSLYPGASGWGEQRRHLGTHQSAL